MLTWNGAAALGLGTGGGAANAKLSRERRYRMRELATQKLSQAYHFDEIAASVATMQSASSLEEVAKLVLQRSPNDSDAKYVHFFHEKIPSRMLAQCTSLNSLDEIIQDRPMDGSVLRTRAVTKIFKDDFIGAARDLTEALAAYRYVMAQHKSGRGELTLANALGKAERKNGFARDWDLDTGIEEEDQPSSLEPQLLFHRAGVYLTLACQHVDIALDGLASEIQAATDKTTRTLEGRAEQSSLEKEAHKTRLEARKNVKTYAKRALRDYMSFLSTIDYTSGLPFEITEEFFRNVNAAANDSTRSKALSHNRLLEMSGNSSLSNGYLSDALVNRKNGNGPHYGDTSSPTTAKYPALPPAEVYQVSELFSSAPPPNLPPYPAISQALVTRRQAPDYTAAEDLTQRFSNHERHEAITYHPLMTDALHSLLLCHSLVQTSPKEHLRHAHMAARLARVCDGYPVFLAARSPSRADWIEVIRRANNWIGLQHSWETLCAPAPLPGHTGTPQKEETEEEAKERRRQEAIMEALADERVHDEASFQAAVSAREKRAEEQRREELGQSPQGPKRWAQGDGKEYPISTERAEAVARWVREAPLSVEGLGKGKRNGKKGKWKEASERAQSVLKDGLDGIITSAEAADDKDQEAEEELD